MTAIKCVAAGLVAVAMLTASALARDIPQAGPSGGGHAHAAGHWSGAPLHMQPLRFGDTEAPPRNPPGGVCDHGDNAMIC
ncbi:hypothetical protein JQ616_10840 [Bradyrhizobium tropiciagri]|uniref:hypothetical protein n=1 Tax=Bradyrhizobium tropiciagri TaxID=312253 RepID=UPI001BAA5FC0|nr:hypothetical protein [Bradyrhizobium tropiciagri]MBR0895444.1 hypothetical protein [Bradyrhizobium tropiciagri]